MHKRYFVALVLSLICSGATFAHSQQGANDQARRVVVHRTEPRYPEIAKRMSLGGTVKVVAVVTTDGKVKKVEPMGGSPILVQAAQDAISQWKFAPGSESREPIEVHFTPPNQ